MPSLWSAGWRWNAGLPPWWQALCQLNHISSADCHIFPWIYRYTPHIQPILLSASHLSSYFYLGKFQYWGGGDAVGDCVWIWPTRDIENSGHLCFQWFRDIKNRKDTTTGVHIISGFKIFTFNKSPHWHSNSSVYITSFGEKKNMLKV